MADQVHELLASLLVIPEHPVHGAGDDVGVLLLDAAHPHAEMLGLDHHPDALGLELLHEDIRELRGHPLLDLEAAREHVREARDLGDPDDLAARQIRDVDLPEERQEVMLAKRVEIDVLDDDHLGVLFGEERSIDDGFRVLGVTAGQLAQGSGAASWSLQETLALGVLADRLQDLAELLFHWGRAPLVGESGRDSCFRPWRPFSRRP
jgi:hypothetical protein